MENNSSQGWVENDKMLIKTNAVIAKNHLLNLFSGLQNLQKELLENFILSPFGIHWKELDAGLSFDGFLHHASQPSVLEKIKFSNL